MTVFAFPWLELSFAVPLAGAAVVAAARDYLTAARWCLGFAAATLGCALLACAAFYTGHASDPGLWDWTGRRMFALDELSALLVPLVALLHLLTALATARTKMPRFSFSGLLADAAVRLALFACVAPWPLVALLVVEAAFGSAEVRRRGQSARLAGIHAAVFVILLILGYGGVDESPGVAVGLLVAAVLLRTGAFPAQVWFTDLFDKATFGTSLLFATPLVGVYAAIRLVLPGAPDWALDALGVVALGTAVYAAGMGVVQTDGRRFFAYLFVSHASLVLVGLALHTPFAVTGALVMWLSSALALTGLGLTLRAVEARVGSLSLAEYRGLYDQSPGLAVCFLLTGLAAVGFPGTAGFVAAELLVDEAVGAHLAVGLLVVLTAAINGIGVVRAYLLLFTGRRHATGVSLAMTPRERVAVLTLIALILGGGLVPQAYLESRNRAAAALLTANDLPGRARSAAPTD
ncbi:MAG TPA: proton-conducting transporter membrane subunit [Gemmataceae bacterium]|jgi:NADH-quinone oxidoreductase subunit M|nr:proton-conducting transporter membrane subunit [Gemmataceae bacterium]